MDKKMAKTSAYAENPWDCKICGQRCESFHEWLEHYRDKHNDEDYSGS